MFARSLALPPTPLASGSLYRIDPSYFAMPALATHLYESEPIAAALEQWVDFERLNASPIETIVTAVEIRSGKLAELSSRRGLKPQHVVASVSLPPVFPATPIDAAWYWDGGLISNTPLRPAINAIEAHNAVAHAREWELVVVDLFTPQADPPKDMTDVMQRLFELVFFGKFRHDLNAKGGTPWPPLERGAAGDFKLFAGTPTAACPASTPSPARRAAFIAFPCAAMPSSALAALHVGTSGWTYEAWRADFYRGVPRARWLEHYASVFDAVEVNATFYHALKRATFARWREATPAAFRFCVKAHRWITHVERLVVEPAALARERDRAAPLGDKLAVVLWQLPQSLQRDFPRLRRFARQLAVWPQPRHAIEFRHPSWFDDEVADCLAAHAIAAVQSDAADWPLWPAVTADWVYVRLHGHAATYRSRYSARQLTAWADKIAAWRRGGRAVWVFFDNTDDNQAPRDALRLRRRCEGRR